jgi:prolyl oligopeptidase
MFRSTALLLALLTATPAFAQPVPEALARPVTESHHGINISDPFRGLERLDDPGVIAWMRAQDAQARGVLAALPERAAFRARLAELDAGGSDSVTRLQRSTDGRLFYLHRGTGDNQFRLVVRDPGAATHRVVADPMVLGGRPGTPFAITRYRISPTGSRVGLVVSAAGSEAGVLHVLDVASGRPLMAPLDRADWALPNWLDEDRFVVQRLQALAAGQDRLDKYRRAVLEQVHLASAPGGARIESLPTRQWADLALDDDSDVITRPLADGRTALAVVFRGVQNEVAMFAGDWSQVASPGARWRRIAGFDDGVVDFSVHGRTLYAISHRGAPRQRVLAWNLDAPEAPPREVLPASDRVTLRIVATRDALVVLQREGNVHRLVQVPHTPGAAAREVALPLGGQIWIDSGWGRDLTSAQQEGLVFGLQGWTRALEYHALLPDGRVQPLNLPRLGAADAPAGLTSTEMLVKSHDGALVPLSLVHRADVRPDGARPVWLQAYASYGFTIDPHFRRDRLAWLERGGVLAFANPRGSGVFGNSWYLAGKGSTKPNTWLDVIACAEHLVSTGWTQPKHLAFSGRSAGGMLAGRVLTARPELFAAVVPGVGVHDMLRAEFEPNGPPNIPEFGSVKTPDGFRALQAMSPYEHVRSGTRYPAVLLTHGMTDPRVAAWHSGKMAARLRAAGPAGAPPVLLRLDFDAGHGVGNTKAQELDEAADTMAFLWAHTAVRP